jgi:hypothetical protein
MHETLLVGGAREERQARLAEIEAVKATVPPELFECFGGAAELAAAYRLISSNPLENVGEIMWRFFIDESKISFMLRGMPDAAFDSVKESLDDIMVKAMSGELELETMVEEPTEEIDVEAATDVDVAEDEAEAVVEPVETIEVQADEMAVAPTNEDVENITPQELETEDGEAVLAAFPDEPFVAPEVPKQPERKRRFEPEEVTPVEAFEEDFDLEDELDDDKRGKKKGKRKKRQLIYDEDAGRVVARRKRKGSRRRDDWEDMID